MLAPCRSRAPAESAPNTWLQVSLQHKLVPETGLRVRGDKRHAPLELSLISSSSSRTAHKACDPSNLRRAVPAFLSLLHSRRELHTIMGRLAHGRKGHYIAATAQGWQVLTVMNGIHRHGPGSKKTVQQDTFCKQSSNGPLWGLRAAKVPLQQWCTHCGRTPIYEGMACTCPGLATMSPHSCSPCT